MKELKKDWLTEDLIDFEYKKYILLAYLQQVRQNFDGKRLYPYLSDLVLHYRNLLSVKENQKLMYENFPRQISKADFERLQLSYQQIVGDDGIMAEIEAIVTYALPKLKDILTEGKDIYEYIEDNLEISPVGISPLYPEEGYLFLQSQLDKETRIYQYQVTLFESADEKYRGIHTTYLESVYRGLGTTYENIKVDLTRRYKQLPNPATYIVASKIRCPLNETLLPIAKRVLVKYIYS
ncbi:MAG: hypothetical protein H7Z75_17760 [Ferruginibacter sp.]|nr:hypothetical protein [Cytophagales bacterium]